MAIFFCRVSNLKVFPALWAPKEPTEGWAGPIRVKDDHLMGTFVLFAPPPPNHKNQDLSLFTGPSTQNVICILLLVSHILKHILGILKSNKARPPMIKIAKIYSGQDMK